MFHTPAHKFKPTTENKELNITTENTVEENTQENSQGWSWPIKIDRNLNIIDKEKYTVITVWFDNNVKPINESKDMTTVFTDGTKDEATGLIPLYFVDPEYIAEVCHDVNRAYCQSLGDFSQPVWNEAPDWQKDSARLGVKLHATNPDAGPQASHESWMAQKIAEGWVYGPEKNPELKTHHCLVPFDQLPVAQQAKDYIFRGIVHAMLKKTK